MPELKDIYINNRNIMFAIPCGDGTINVRLAGVLMEAQEMLRGHGAGFGFVQVSYNSLVTRARNQLVQAFLDEEKYTDFFMIDSDVVPVLAEYVVQLVARCTDHPVVAGAYPTKLYGKSGEMQYRVDYENDELKVTEDGLIPIRRIGAGFMNIRREAIVNVVEASPVYQRKADREVNPLVFRENIIGVEAAGAEVELIGEDYSFCDLLRECGIPIMLDPAVELYHVKETDLHGQFGNHVLGPPAET